MARRILSQLRTCIRRTKIRSAGEHHAVEYNQTRGNSGQCPRQILPQYALKNSLKRFGTWSLSTASARLTCRENLASFGRYHALSGFRLQEAEDSTPVRTNPPDNASNQSALARVGTEKAEAFAGRHLNIFGETAESAAARAALGWVPQELAIYPRSLGVWIGAALADRAGCNRPNSSLWRGEGKIFLLTSLFIGFLPRSPSFQWFSSPCALVALRSPPIAAAVTVPPARSLPAGANFTRSRFLRPLRRDEVILPNQKCPPLTVPNGSQVVKSPACSCHLDWRSC
jgi:hypothetical protein